MERVEEHQALKILIAVFADTYSNCVIADKPDIQAKDGSLGVEVTIATNKDKMKAIQALHTNALNYIGDKRKICSNDRLRDIISSAGGELCESHGVPICKTNQPSIEETQEIILNRIEDKQNNKLCNYRGFPHKQLFVYGNTDCLCTILYVPMLNKILATYRERYLGNNHFDKIFVTARCVRQPEVLRTWVPTDHHCAVL